MSYIEKIYEVLEIDKFIVLSDCVVTSKDNKLYVVPNSMDKVYDLESVKILNGENILNFCNQYASEIDFTYNELCQLKENNEVKRAAM